MRTLKRPMFNKGGSTNEGIMTGLVDRKGYAEGSPFVRDIKKLFSGEGLLYDFGVKPAYNIAATPINYLTGSELSADKLFRPQAEGEASTFASTFGFPSIESRLKRREGMVSRAAKEMETGSGIPRERTDIMGMGESGMPGYTTEGNTITAADLKRAKQQTETRDEKMSRLTKRAEEFAELLNPGARKRVMNAAMASASEEFGKSEGDTKQDIARAITAYAKETGKVDDLTMAARKMAIEEDIKKGIARESFRPNPVDSTIAAYESLKNPDGTPMYSKAQILEKIKSAPTKTQTLSELYSDMGSDVGTRTYVKQNYDVVDTFSAAEFKKLKTEDLADGMYYIGPGKDGDKFFVIKDKTVVETKPGVI